MTKQKEVKTVELTTRQIQEINNQTGNGRFNAQQQSAILEAIKVALNPEQYADAESEAVPAQDQAQLEKEQAERDARAVKLAQDQARALDEAQTRPNVINTGNVDSVAETTAARAAEVAALREAATSDQPSDAKATTAAKKVK